MRRLCLVLVLAALLVVSACQPERLRAPVFGGAGAGNFPDPSILYADGWYYAYSTTSLTSPQRNIQAMRSHDLFHWESVRDVALDVMPTGPSWAWSGDEGGEFWAPSVARFGSTYVMYFGAQHRAAPISRPGWCIGYATATSPAGPFIPGEQPLFCQVTSHTSVATVIGGPSTDRGSIDPQVFTAPSGVSYLYFKSLDNPYQLWGIRLSADGLTTLRRAHGLVALPAQARTWEYSARLGFTVLENPAMDYNPSPDTNGFNYYLYYSGGEWQSPGYATGVAACRKPLGPCIRATSSEPWLASRNSTSGPGGLSLFHASDGQRWVAYHSWRSDAALSEGRRLHVEPLDYAGITPVLLNRPPGGTFAARANARAGRVDFSGAADDPDTGQQAVIDVTEGPTTISRRRVRLDTTFSFSITGAVAGPHQYCAAVEDDDGGAPVSLGCLDVTVVG